MDLSREGAVWVEQPEAGDVAEPPTAEWTVAAMAHATICLTVALMLAGGIGLVVGPVAALAIHVVYRARSRFVAFHALQSIAYQVGGAVALLLLGATGVASVAAAWELGGLVSEGLSGIVLRLLALPFSMVVAGGLFGVTLSWLAYGLYAAFQVYQGRNFRYWLIGDWVAGEVGQ